MSIGLINIKYMFNILILEDIISLNPIYIGGNIVKKILDTIINMYKGKISGKIDGYIIDIIDIGGMSDGIINDLTGYIMYNVKYRATVFKPVVGDVLSIIINHCNNLGIWGNLELLNDSRIECFIPDVYLKENNYRYIDYVNEWTNKDKTIRLSSIINLKTINYKIDTNKITIIGSIKE